MQPWLEFLDWVGSEKQRYRLLMAEFEQIQCRDPAEFIQYTRTDMAGTEDTVECLMGSRNRQLEAFVQVWKLTSLDPEQKIKYWA